MTDGTACCASSVEIRSDAVTDRQEHIDGLGLSKMTPADIEVFFRLLPNRMPKGAPKELQSTLDQARSRVKQLAVDLGSVDARSADASDVEGTCELVIDQLVQMKRRQWRSRIDGTKTIDHVRQQVGEISADLHALSGG